MTARSVWVELMGAQVHHLGSAFRTRVIESGDGPPLLLMHGIGGHAEAWSRNVVRLGQVRRAMAIDLVWHGFSTGPAYVPGEDVPMYARQVIDLLDSEGIDRIDIEGESLGGWIGLWMALNHPDRLGRLVLNTTAGIRWKPGSIPEKPAEGRQLLAQRSLAAIANPTRETIQKRLEWLMASPDRVTEELVDIRYRIYADPVIQASLRTVFEDAFGEHGAPRKLIPEDQLANVRVPTLVLWTGHNPGTGPEVGQKIAQLIPGARFACIEDAGHWPQWEQAEQHDQIVEEFLSATSDPS